MPIRPPVRIAPPARAHAAGPALAFVLLTVLAILAMAPAAHAATGAICVAGAALIEGSAAHAVCQRDATDPAAVRVEHPKGTIEITLDADKNENAIAGAAVIRTARPIFMGSVLVPAALWPAEEVQPLAA